jgi:CubicO group peptidase (beta-lactamase class C family)
MPRRARRPSRPPRRPPPAAPRPALVALGAALLGAALAGPPPAAAAQPPAAPAVPAAPAPADVVLPPPGDPLAGFDAYVERARRDWGVPGLAVAVVRNDSVVFLRGYGVRALGAAAPVDAHTLFANASTTKAFTAAAAATLVDEGRLRWDAAAADLVPGFAVRDPVATRELTLRDLLRHTVGFGDPGHLWYARDDSLGAILPRLRVVAPAAGGRARFAYNNVGYAVAGAAVARAAGQPSWDAVVRARLLGPLGMAATRTRGAELAGGAAANVARPHDLVADTLRPLPDWTLRLVDGVAPAGAMYSTAADMTRWLRFLLAGGRLPDGRRLITEDAFAELLAPQALVPADEFYPTARLTRPAFTAYGLGWFLQDYRGEKAAYHTGSIDGTVAIVGLLPARRVGLVVFANRDHAELRHALMLRVFDAHLGPQAPQAPQAAGAAPRDWSAELRELYEGAARARRLAGAGGRPADPRPPRPAADYAGAYTDSLYGGARVRAERAGLVLELSPHLVADLAPRGADAFTARWRAGWMEPTPVAFTPGADGRPAHPHGGRRGLHPTPRAAPRRPARRALTPPDGPPRRRPPRRRVRATAPTGRRP